MSDPVVADASPIISFARAGVLSILKQVLPRVLLPPAVFRELTSSSERPGAQDVLASDWAVQRELDDPAAADRFLPLHSGEREALALAVQLGHRLLADERRVINAGRAEGLEVITSLRVLTTAKNDGLIPAVRPVLDDLRAYTFRLSPRLYEHFLRLMGELPSP